ncbi:MAG: hypothetical protein NVSMB57_03170 [Actinomycetota bacterium]
MKRIIVPFVCAALLLSACGDSKVESGPVVPSMIAGANAAAGCDGVFMFKQGGRAHVPKGTVVDYKTQPPTSGDHLQIWGATGVYSQMVPDELLVHNLEHGHVVIWYVPGKVSPAIISGLVDLVKKNKKWVLLVPRPAAKFIPAAKIAFTAWQRMQRCPEPTADVVVAAKSFIEKYGKTAPEKIGGDPIFETPPSS